MAREVVEEASACTARARFFGPGNIATTPANVRYRIKDVTNDRIVTDWTEVPSAEVVVVDITADENRIYRDSSRRFKRHEQRVVVFQANFGLSTQSSKEIDYQIHNQRGFDS